MVSFTLRGLVVSLLSDRMFLTLLLKLYRLTGWLRMACWSKRVWLGGGYENWDVEDLPRNMWVILSLDGVGEYHDRSRAHSGLYEELAARFYKTHRSKRTLTTTTLHTGNADQSAKLLEQWRDADILGMTFEFATPIGRAANPQLDLIGDARNKVIDDLIRLKKKYGGGG